MKIKCRYLIILPYHFSHHLALVIKIPNGIGNHFPNINHYKTGIKYNLRPNSINLTSKSLNSSNFHKINLNSKCYKWHKDDHRTFKITFKVKVTFNIVYSLTIHFHRMEHLKLIIIHAASAIKVRSFN